MIVCDTGSNCQIIQKTSSDASTTTINANLVQYVVDQVSEQWSTQNKQLAIDMAYW